MATKYLSVLGNTDYHESIYSYEGKEVKTNFIQEAIAEIKMKELKSDDKIIIFLTKGARKQNWENGLKDILISKYDKRQIIDMDIPEGKTEEELWTIFEIIYDSLENDDKVIFDITNGFRSIPMHAMAVLNYAKVLKNISIEGIYYGAFLKERSEYTPIFNLKVYFEIMEWSSAAESFIKYGNSKHIYDLYNKKSKELKKSSSDLEEYKELKLLGNVVDDLHDITNCIMTSRGNVRLEEKLKNKNKKAKKSTYYATLYFNEDMKNLKVENKEKIKPLKPLFEKMQNSVSGFNVDDNLKIGLETIRWCKKNGMIQNAYTAFEETIKTYICKKFGIPDTGEDNRDKIVKCAINNITSKKINDENKCDEHCEKIKMIMNNIPEEFVQLSNKVSTFRNDMNHFGFTKETSEYKKFSDELEELFDKFEKYIEKYKNIDFKKR